MEQKEDKPQSKHKYEIETTFGEITEKNIGQLKLLNQVIFPVAYNEKFYSDLLQSWLPLSTLVFHTDVLVGAVCCRIESHPPTDKPIIGPSKETTEAKRMYIMTLGVLAPYRNLGIGSKLLNFVFQLLKDKPYITSLYLHVQTSNQEAINFYKKFGFEIKQTIPNYYKNIDPPDCYLLEKALIPST